MVLCGTKNGSSMASLEEPFEAPLFLRVWKVLDMYHLPKDCCRPRSPIHCNGVSWCQRLMQDNASCHTEETVQELFEEHDEVFKALPWPPNSPDLSSIEHLWNVLDQQNRSMEAPPHNLCISVRTCSEVLWSPCFNASELFWQHKGDLYDN